MNTKKRQKYTSPVLALIISLLLCHPPLVAAFQQNNNETGTAGGEKASGVAMQTVSGMVVETMNSGGYTYALVDENGAKTWVALPKSTIAVGNEITCRPGMVMNDFRSASLNRTFKHIVFSSGLASTSGAGAHPAATPTPDEAPAMPKTKEPKNWKDF